MSARAEESQAAATDLGRKDARSALQATASSARSTDTEEERS